MLLRALLVAATAVVATQLVYVHLQGDPAFPGRNSAEQEHPPITCNVLGHDDAVQRFSRLLQFPTVGSGDAEWHVPPEARLHFNALIEYLPAAYPAVWSTCKVEMVGAGQYSLLLTWQGSDPSLLPMLFISHYDVVPVSNGTDGNWLHGPFSGAIKDGYIWGRGALDIKFGVAAILETLSLLIQDGYVPQRTIYVAFGHDEEVGGMLGASKIAELLGERGVRLEVVVDEGGVVFTDGVKPLTSKPVALVATSEKVYSMVQVTVSSAGGHSSMPPTDGSDVATQIAKLLTYVHAHPFKSVLRPPFSDLLKAIAPHADNPLAQYVLRRCNVWPLRSLVLLGTSSSPGTAAQVRTTVAVTRISAGVANNVLPQQGTVMFNVRSHPYGTTHEDAVAYFTNAIRKTGILGHVELALGSFEGAQRPAVTDSQGPHFMALKQAIQETWRHDGKGVVVAPMLMTGGTDSKHYTHLTQHGVLRFTPYTMNRTAGDLDRIHGTNERVPVHDFKRALCTYRRLIHLLSQAQPPSEAVL